jgi:chromosomal replication initiation ATPase DnaA
LARTLTPNSMPSLATYFGMKDHTAVWSFIPKYVASEGIEFGVSVLAK